MSAPESTPWNRPELRHAHLEFFQDLKMAEYFLESFEPLKGDRHLKLAGVAKDESLQSHTLAPSTEENWQQWLENDSKTPAEWLEVWSQTLERRFKEACAHIKKSGVSDELIQRLRNHGTNFPSKAHAPSRPGYRMRSLDEVVEFMNASFLSSYPFRRAFRVLKRNWNEVSLLWDRTSVRYLSEVPPEIVAPFLESCVQALVPGCRLEMTGSDHLSLTLLT